MVEKEYQVYLSKTEQLTLVFVISLRDIVDDYQFGISDPNVQNQLDETLKWKFISTQDKLFGFIQSVKLLLFLLIMMSKRKH